jgi:hypothetical protein
MARETQDRNGLVKQLVALLQGGQAHATLEKATESFPEEFRGRVADGLPYSAWQIVEHIRIAQRDILDFCAPPEGGYQHRQWPREYWPAGSEPPSASSWEESLGAIREDAARFEGLLRAEEADLFTPFAWGDGQDLLREALLIADHNAYHTGELVVLRRLLGIWPA